MQTSLSYFINELEKVQNRYGNAVDITFSDWDSGEQLSLKDISVNPVTHLCGNTRTETVEVNILLKLQ